MPILNNLSFSKFTTVLTTYSIGLLLAACQAQPGAIQTPIAEASTPPVQVGVTELAHVEPSPTPACTSLASDMTLSVTPLTPSTAQLEITGLQPGETPVLVYFSLASEERHRTNEEWSVETVDDQGHYSARLTNMQILKGNTINLWQLRVIHQLGVACTEVTLPST
jgi:hypothetical protein